MKKFLLIIALFAIIAGCSKHEVVDELPADIWNGYQNYKSYMQVELYAGQHILVGTVTYEFTTDALFKATYDLTGGWTMSESHLYAGDYDQLPTNKPGAPKIGNFPFQETHDPAVTTYTYTIPVADLPPGENGFVCAAHCVVNNPNGGDETGWAKGNRTFSDKGWGSYTDDYFQQATDIPVIYGIQKNEDGTLVLIHINGYTQEVDIILTEILTGSGVINAVAYDANTGNLFFVLDGNLWVNNLNSENPSVLIGPLPGLAGGGVFIGGNYYYIDVDPNSGSYMEIIEVQIQYDENNGWSLIIDDNYSSPLPYDYEITDLATNGQVIYLAGIDDNGTPDDESDDNIYLITYDNGSYSAILTGLSGVAQIAYGPDGNLYAINVDEDGNTRLVLIEPGSGDMDDSNPIDDDLIGADTEVLGGPMK